MSKKKLSTVREYFDNNSTLYIKNSIWSNNKSINNVIKEIVSHEKPSILLDLGAGSGEVSNVLNQVKTRIAVDVSQNMLKKITSVKIIKILADIHKLPFLDNYADFIICRQVLHYCKLDVVFKEIHRVLSPKGRLLIIQMTDFENIPIKWYNEWKSFKQIRNRKYLSCKAIQSEADISSFTLIEKRGLRVNLSYNWNSFYEKYNAVNETERNIIYNFFHFTSEKTKSILNLKLTKSRVSFDRNFTFLLYSKS